MSQERKCSVCHEVKPLDEAHFQRNRTKAGGFAYECKTCRDAYDKDRDAKRAHTERRALHRRAANANTRAGKLKRKGKLKTPYIFIQLEAQGRRCYWCGEPITAATMHTDHIIPMNAGGTNTPDNIVCACASCNIRKGDKTRSQWVAALAARGIDHAERATYGHALQERLFDEL